MGPSQKIPVHVLYLPGYFSDTQIAFFFINSSSYITGVQIAPLCAQLVCFYHDFYYCFVLCSCSCISALKSLFFLEPRILCEAGQEVEEEPGLDCERLTFFPVLNEASLVNEDFSDQCTDTQIILQELVPNEEVRVTPIYICTYTLSYDVKTGFNLCLA